VAWCHASLPSWFRRNRSPSPAPRLVQYDPLVPFKNADDLRSYQRLWRTRRRRAWLKKNGPCKRCGSRKHLHVDHIDPNKKIDHRVWTWSKVRRERELKKCQVLCAKCHVAKTVEDGARPGLTHGRCGMYESGCRCVACRAWKRGVNAQRKARGWL